MKIISIITSWIDRTNVRSLDFGKADVGLFVRLMIKSGFVLTLVMLPIYLILFTFFGLADAFPSLSNVFTDIGMVLGLLLFAGIVVTFVIVAVNGIRESIRVRRSVRRYEAKLRNRN